MKKDRLVYDEICKNILPLEYGYDRYFRECSKNSRFLFVKYDDKGHNGVCDPVNNGDLYKMIDDMYRKYSQE